MNELLFLNQHYEHINDELKNLRQILNDIDKDELWTEGSDRLEKILEFVGRDIKNSLRVEHETLFSLKRTMGNKQSEELESAINEHGVLSGAINQLIYGIKMQSKPDVAESAKTMLEHFPRHMRRINTIVENSKQVLH